MKFWQKTVEFQKFSLKKNFNVPGFHRSFLSRFKILINSELSWFDCSKVLSWKEVIMLFKKGETAYFRFQPEVRR